MKNNNIINSYPNLLFRQRGLSMIEILVSVLILSIGLLGIAGLQGTSLNSTRSASLRTQAIILSQDILESMRVNRDEALIDGNTNKYVIDYTGTLATPDADCMVGTCSPAELAETDMFNWWQSIYDTQDASNKSKFPLGQGKITVNVANSLVTVSIKWRDNVRQSTNDPDLAVNVFTTFSITSKL